LNSLKYFWKARTPDETAADVTRILRHYLAAWGRDRVLLIGYSFGAEVLPFVVNRLPDDLRRHVDAVDMLGASTTADFEIRVEDWIPGVADDGTPIRPEVLRMHDMPLLCIHGATEKDSLCPTLPPDRATSAAIGQGHHFGGDYAAILTRILSFPAGGA
jgi:type IV secretory pathway VirJ component